MKHFVLVAAVMMFTGPAFAGEADVVGVKVSKGSNGAYRFDVTLKHGDEGWNHYADKWEVVAPDGRVLATRVLAHPHVDEQPFTRSKSGVLIPDGVKHVIVRAGDSVHGTGGKEMRVNLD